MFLTSVLLREGIGGVIGLGLLLGVPAPQWSETQAQTTLTPQGIIVATNQARSLAGQAAVVTSQSLQTAAQTKAEQMAMTGDFSHTLSSGQTPWSFITNAGYCYSAAAENLAIHYTSDTEVVAGWLASPSHRASLLNGRYQNIGIGIASGHWQGFDGYLVVQLFGTELHPMYQPYVAHCSS